MGKDCATLPAANVAEKFYATRNKFIISTGHNKLFRGLFEIVRARFHPFYVRLYTRVCLTNSILIMGHDKFSSKSLASFYPFLHAREHSANYIFAMSAMKFQVKHGDVQRRFYLRLPSQSSNKLRTVDRANTTHFDFHKVPVAEATASYTSGEMSRIFAGDHSRARSDLL